MDHTMSRQAYRVLTTASYPCDVYKDEVVYDYTGPTYGAISSSGIAVTRDPEGGTPFLEVERNNLTPLRS